MVPMTPQSQRIGSCSRLFRGGMGGLGRTRGGVYPTNTVGIASRGQQVRSSTDQPGALVLRKDLRSEHAPHHRAYLPTMCVRETVGKNGSLGPCAAGAPCGCSDLGRRLYNMEVNIIWNNATRRECGRLRPCERNDENVDARPPLPLAARARRLRPV